MNDFKEKQKKIRTSLILMLLIYLLILSLLITAIIEVTIDEDHKISLFNLAIPFQIFYILFSSIIIVLVILNYVFKKDHMIDLNKELKRISSICLICSAIIAFFAFMLFLYSNSLGGVIIVIILIIIITLEDNKFFE
ncbi:MAG: hypothetical protein JXA99_05235 [Candidatus Lokiarchaeota archaeon]|nr:hypothetical protein [Candidatus Lokiarchaeota archaeon]